MLQATALAGGTAVTEAQAASVTGARLLHVVAPAAEAAAHNQLAITTEGLMVC